MKGMGRCSRARRAYSMEILHGTTLQGLQAGCCCSKQVDGDGGSDNDRELLFAAFPAAEEGCGRCSWDGRHADELTVRSRREGDSIWQARKDKSGVGVRPKPENFHRTLIDFAVDFAICYSRYPSLSWDGVNATKSIHHSSSQNHASLDQQGSVIVMASVALLSLCRCVDGRLQLAVLGSRVARDRW